MGDWKDQYLDAWNSHDGGQVAALMAENVRFEDLADGVVHDGRDAVIVQNRDYWNMADFLTQIGVMPPPEG